MSHGELTIDYSQKAIPAKVQTIGLGLLVGGLVLLGIGFGIDAQRAAFAGVMAFMFLLSVGMGSLFFVALEYVAGAVWSTPFRRIAELMTNILWIAPLFALPAIINIYSHQFEMYHWVHPVGDKILEGKASYLNPNFFLIRTVAILFLMLIFRTLLVKGSLKQDESKDQKITKRNVIISAIFMPIFAISITIMGIDYMMSLEPHWFSTMFGVYYFAGTVWVTMAVLTIIALNLNENKYLVNGINKDHYYSLGGLMFAFTAFWTYIAFSQFMLIWYANLPEETFWFMPRMEGWWSMVSIGLIFVHFVIPFGLLINRTSKLDPKRLKAVAWYILFAHFYDIYWIMYPTYSHLTDSHAPAFGWIELSVIAAAIGALITVFYISSKNTNLVAIGDPKLQRGLDFHL